MLQKNNGINLIEDEQNYADINGVMLTICALNDDIEMERHLHLGNLPFYLRERRWLIDNHFFSRRSAKMLKRSACDFMKVAC